MLQPVAFGTDHQQYIAPTWDDLDRLTVAVARQITATEPAFDLIVALAKGAWPMSRSLVDYTQIAELASLGVKFYSGINERLAEPSIYQTLPTSVKGKRILLFDDVADTGESLLFVKDYLLAQGASSVSTATLFFKPWSKCEPDFYGDTSEAWIIFPFEKREMHELLSSKWREQGVGEQEIEERVQQLNIEKTWG
jgi:hypoxanthine phosphoribosyltransferase